MSGKEKRMTAPKYIEAERLKLCFHTNVVSGDAFDEIIDMQPAADVRENRRGRWINYGNWKIRCSICGFLLDKYAFSSRFCPDCGASMSLDPEEHRKESGV